MQQGDRRRRAELADLYPAGRLELAAAAAAQAGLDALLLTPGPDLRYLTGYDTHQSERLTCLAVPAAGRAFLVVPRLELASAQASPASGMGLDSWCWDETDDPYQAVAQRLGSPAAVGLAGQMWAMMVLRFRDAMPGARQALAASALRALRIRKTPAEVAALAEAGAAIDRVHAAVPQWLRPGRTEREAAADIAERDRGEGHARIDFVDRRVRPERGQPHHEPSGRVLRRGRRGRGRHRRHHAQRLLLGLHPHLRDRRGAAGLGPLLRGAAGRRRRRRAPRSGRASARRRWTPPRGTRSPRQATASTSPTGPGTASAWRPTRTRTSCRATPRQLEPGMAFSVEPGIYPGPHGARIEDIVVCTARRLPSGSTTPAGISYRGLVVTVMRRVMQDC